MYALRAKVKSVCTRLVNGTWQLIMCDSFLRCLHAYTRLLHSFTFICPAHAHSFITACRRHTPLPQPPSDSGSHRFLIDLDIHDNPVKGCGHPIRVFPRYVHFPANPHWNWGSLQTPPSPCQQTFHLRPFLCDPVGMCQGTCPRVKR